MADWTTKHGVIVDCEAGVWLVSLTGEFDLENINELRLTLDSLIAPESFSLPHPVLVVIDLSKVAFMDSTVIQVLARAHELAEHDRDTHLAVVIDSPESFPARVLRLVGMTRRLPTYTSRSAAMSALIGHEGPADTPI